MIKFFRKIRYNLMSQNKTGRYFKYAIGEIILVVIGILIAIQLNEWRNNTLNTKQKQNVLKSLKVEFESNKSQLDTVLFYQNKIQDAYPIAMDLIKKDTADVDDSTYVKPYLNLGYAWTFDPINGALRSAISSGEIHLIKNEHLIKLLFSWEDLVKDSEEEGDRAIHHKDASYEFRQKYVRTHDALVGIVPGLVPSHYPSDYKSLFKDPLFEDYASLCYLDSRGYTNELNIIKKNNLEILQLIEEELNN